MSFLRGRPIAQWLEFLDQLLVPATAFRGRGKFERESRWLKTNYARIVAAQVLEEPRPQVVGLAEIDPEGVEEAVHAGGFRRVLQNAFALKEVPAVASLGEGHALPVFDALYIYVRLELKK
jgi:hypothetical protein